MTNETITFILYNKRPPRSSKIFINITSIFMSRYIYIIAEYNPPHTGHAYMIDELRRTCGEATFVAIMSGNFVERGSVAVANKYVRAKAAMALGVDLVLSLPFPWCCASAEFFAHAGVAIAGSLAAALPDDEHILAFGSECGDIEKLKLTGSRLASDGFREKLSSLPASERTARGIEQIYAETYPDGSCELLRSPNNTLAVEYLRAIYELGAKLSPVTVKRLGAAHDTDESDVHPSASYVRERIFANENIAGLVPDAVYDILTEEITAHGAARDESFGDAILGILRMLSPENADSFAECSGGVGRRLVSSARASASLKDALSLAATKQYTNARLRRAAVFAARGITADDLRALPEYTALLAANAKGTSALRKLSRNAKIGILTKSADAEKKLTESAKHQFDIDAQADALYTLAFDPHLPADAFSRLSPYVTKNDLRKELL